MRVSLYLFVYLYKKYQSPQWPHFFRMGTVDARCKVGCKVYALAKHVQSETKCKRQYGSNWSSEHVNGVVMLSRDARKTYGKMENYVCLVRFALLNCEKEVELNI